MIKPFYKNELQTIYHCDNLELLNQLDSDSIDLIYSDILFNTGKNFPDYSDNLGSSQKAIEWYKPRFLEMKRVLSINGQILIHADFRLVHYIKVLMDEVFGEKNFINEIIWHYSNSGLKAKSKKLHQTHDTILRYSKSKIYTHNRIMKPRKDGQSKQAKRKFNSETKKADMVRDEFGKIVYQVTYDVLENSVIEVPRLKTSNYSTEKPPTLIQKLVLMCSNEKDLVADFFMGSGVTAEVCKEKGRRFIGCDISKKAVEMTVKRINE